MDDNGGKGWIVADKYYVTTKECSYEEGELSDGYSISWDWVFKKRVYTSKEELQAAVMESDFLFRKLEDADFCFRDGCILWHAMSDMDNMPPDEEQYERFRKGEERLCVAYGRLPLSWVPAMPEVMTDDKAESFGFSIG